MKSIKILVLVLFAVSAYANDCDYEQRDAFVSGWDTAETVQVITRPIAPGGKIHCSYYPDRDAQMNLRVKRESGKIEGVEYSIYYTDGSGTVQGRPERPLADKDYRNNWQLGCRRQTGSPPVCRLRKGDLQLGLRQDGPTTVNVGRQGRSGSRLLIRVDRHHAFTAMAENGFTAQQSAQIIAQMKNGHSMDIHFHPQDMEKATYNSLTLFGFNQALSIGQWVLEQLPHSPEAGR